MVFYDRRKATVTSTCFGACKRSLLCIAANRSLGVAEKAAQDILGAVVTASVLTEIVGRIFVTILVNASVF